MSRQFLLQILVGIPTFLETIEMCPPNELIFNLYSSEVCLFVTRQKCCKNQYMFGYFHNDKLFI